MTRCVVVGDHQIEPFEFQQFAHCVDICCNGHHAATIAVALTHQLAPQAGQSVQIRLIDTCCSAQRYQLAITVAGRELGIEAEMLQHPEGAQADRANCRLSILGQSQLGLLTGAIFCIEHRDRIDLVTGARTVTGFVGVGRGQGLGHLWKLAGKIAQHTDVLRTLARKQSGSAALCCTAGVTGAQRRAPKTIIGISQQYQTVCEYVGQTDLVLFQCNDQALRLLSIVHL